MLSLIMANCQCKNTCSRSGKRGSCPCKQMKRYCSDLCQCDHLVPCTNREDPDIDGDLSFAEFMKKQGENHVQRKRFLPLDVPEIPAKVCKLSKLPIPSTVSRIKPASSRPQASRQVIPILAPKTAKPRVIPTPARSKAKPASAKIPTVAASTTSTPASTTSTPASTTSTPASTTLEQTPGSLLIVQKYIDGLDEVTRRELLTQMILGDDATLQRAVSALDEPDPQPPSDQPSVSWCHCGNCRPMPNEVENKCCVKRGGQWVTTTDKFNRVVMDEDVLDAAGAYRNDMYAYNHVRNHRMFRHTAYRQFILMTHGVLRAGQRKVVPSCVVLAVRHRYPATDGQSTGFRAGPRI